MKTKSTVAVIAICVVGIGLASYLARVGFENPKACAACHFIDPYYKKWQTSTHNMVPCLKCHVYSPERALAGQFLFLAGAYNPRPLTNVPDKNCLQAGCHDRRLIESRTTVAKRGISFDHKPHFTEMKRGVRLHCRSCHSDIVQGEHLKVSMNVCYLCHFKGVAHDQAQSGCPSCHAAPTKDIPYQGTLFSHQGALKAGHKCVECHLEITRGDGVVPLEKCYFCHVDRAEKYKDVKLIHDKHVGEKQVDCLYCHPRIEHGMIKMAVEIPR
jgi:nitrate/TMAO reductase-like tetraheme cytochrome c subunit